jgi:integrase/recombinase XerD
MNNMNTHTPAGAFDASVVGPYLRRYIESNPAQDDRYGRNRRFLRIIDEYCGAQGLEEPCFTERFIDDWIETLSIRTKYERELLLRMMRKFSAFLASTRKDSYVLPVPVKQEYKVRSILAPYIVEFVGIKRGQGLKYIGEDFALKSFDKYCCEQRLRHLCDVTDFFIRQWHRWRSSSPNHKDYTYAVRELLIFMKVGKGLAVSIPKTRFKEAHPRQEVAYRSAFAPLLDEFIAQKVASGFKYESEREILKFFDLLCIESGLVEPVLTREIVQAWSVQRPTEGALYRVKRISIIRQFALFLISRGNRAYIAPTCPAVPPVKPHVFRDEELVAFFSCCDRYTATDPLVELALPVIFRFYHCLGLRLSEARDLRCDDVDLASGRVEIRMAKCLKDRVVYLPADLLEVTRAYSLEVARRVPERTHLFVTDVLGTPFGRTSLAKHFDRIWQMTGYAQTVDKKPSIQSFRHTMVVRKLEEWYRQKEDYSHWLPYLSAFLGHSSLKETYHYIHLVDSAFPLIREGDKLFEHLYPEEAAR